MTTEPEADETPALCWACEVEPVEEDGEQCGNCADADAESAALDRYWDAMEAESERIAQRWDREF